MNITKTPVLNVKEIGLDLPIELSVAKNFLKVDFDDDNELIIKLIRTAVNQCETIINKSIIKKTYVYSIYELKNKFVLLPYQPIDSIDSIKVVNVDNTSSAIDVSEFYLDKVGGILNFKSRPDNFYRLDIEYTAGLSEISDEIAQAILMHVARMYEDRSGYSPIPLNSMNIYRKYKQIKI